MKSNFIFSLVIAVMIHGGLLNPNYSFGFVNQDAVASVSSLEMWHLSKENGVVKWTPKVSDVIPDTKSVSSQDLFSLQLSCHIIDTRISLLLSDKGISTKTLVVVDVDPGTDDAVALYLCKLLQLAPTHFVATMGNRSLENTLCNLLILKNMFGLNGVVVRGMDTSMLGKLPDCGGFHGYDGLANLQDSLRKIYVTSEDYASCRTLDDLAHDILSSESCIYIATGPLSSLAYIMEKYKDRGIENHISKVLIMGGGINRFNVSGDREYNFAGDGQAVNAVFSSSLDITLFPLDITELCATIDSRRLNKLESSPEVHEVIKKVIEQNFKSNIEITPGAIGAVLHDCLPILYLMFPDKFELEDIMLGTDATGRITKDTTQGRMIHVAKSCDPDLVFITILAVNNGKNTGDCQQDPSKTEEIIILFETDVHGELENYAHLAHLADSLSALGKRVFIVSGGDFSSGSCITNFTKGEAPIRIINKILQYAALVYGNHEWDYGFNILKRNDSLLTPPMICCNVFYRDSLLFKPYTIVNAGEKRIAFIGVLTCETKAVASPAELKASGDYRFLDGDSLAFQVQKYVDEVRRDSMADYVVLLAHLGNESFKSSEKKGISKKTSFLISHISGVDVVLNGHDHVEIDSVLCDKKNKQIPELATGQFLAKIGIIKIFTDGTLSTELLPIAKVKGTSSKINATIDSIQNCFPSLKEPLGEIRFPLIADNIRIKETNLGDYVADAILWAAKHTDSRVLMALINSGSVRKNISEGSYEQFYNAVPFSNQICIVKLKGSEIERTLNQMIGEWPMKSGGFPQVAGITFSLDTLGSNNKAKNIMVRLLDDTWVPLDSNEVYYVATTDFIAYGGDNIDMKIDIKTDVIPLKTKMYMIDAVTEFFKMYGVASKYENPDKRIKTPLEKTNSVN